MAQPPSPGGPNNPDATAIQYRLLVFTIGSTSNPSGIKNVLVPFPEWTYAFEARGNAGRQPYGPPQLPPSLLIVPEPPHAHGGRWPSAVQRSAYSAYPDPWTFDYLARGNSGRQPYGPTQLPPSTLLVPEPPHVQGGPVTAIQEIAQLAQPDPWVRDYLGPAGGTQPYGPRRLPPSTLLVPEPPHVQGGPVTALQEIAQGAQPDPWVRDYLGPAGGVQPYAQRQLSAAIPGQSVDNPVPNQDTLLNLLSIVGQWQPPPPQPQQQGKLSPGIPGQSADPPPPRTAQQQSFPLPDQAPQQPRFGPPAAAVVVQGAFTVAPILTAWQPPDPLPTLPRNLAPGIPGQSVDNPAPNLGSINLNVIVKAWQPPDPLPTLPRVVIPLGEIDTNLSLPQFVEWKPDGRWFNFVGGSQPYAPRTLSPGIPGQSVDPPPPNEDEDVNLAVIARAWQPPDPLPTLPLGVAASSSVPPAPQTPFVFPPITYTVDWPYSFQGGLQPYAPRQLDAGDLAVEVDDPPFTYAGPYALQTAIVQLSQPAWVYNFPPPVTPQEGPPPPPPPVLEQPPGAGKRWPLPGGRRPIWDKGPEILPSAPLPSAPERPKTEARAPGPPAENWKEIERTILPEIPTAPAQRPTPTPRPRHRSRIEIVEEDDTIAGHAVAPSQTRIELADADAIHASIGSEGFAAVSLFDDDSLAAEAQVERRHARAATNLADEDTVTLTVFENDDEEAMQFLLDEDTDDEEALRHLLGRNDGR
jgi:hypothetical protein